MKFSYRAGSEKGVRVGSIEAVSAEAAAEQLRKAGLFPITIQAGNRDLPFTAAVSAVWNRLASIGTVPLSEKTLFFKELETFVGSGVSLGASLQYLAQNVSCRPLARKIRRMQKDVDEGGSLSSAMAECGAFDVLARAVVAVGEETGRLDNSLALIAGQYERRETLRKKTLSALTYPAIVLIFSGVVLFVLFHSILPRFKDVFAHMNAELPPLTRRLIGLSESGPASALIALAAAAAVIILFLLLRRLPKARFMMDSAVLRIPVIGTVLAKASAARCMRMLGVLLKSGAPLLRSLELSSQVTRNSAFSAAMMSLHSAAAQGGSLGGTAAQLKVFQPMAAQLISVGEQTGQLEKMLLKIADWYELDLEESVKRLTSVIEPCMILIVGAVAAVAAFALFSPILSVVRTLSTEP